MRWYQSLFFTNLSQLFVITDVLFRNQITKDIMASVKHVIGKILNDCSNNSNSVGIPLVRTATFFLKFILFFTYLLNNYFNILFIKFKILPVINELMYE